MSPQGDAFIEFSAWCHARDVKFKDSKVGRNDARQCFKVWYLSRAEHSQKMTEVRRELEWMKKELHMLLKST